MNLESSYQLLGVIRDDGIRTYRALEIASGEALQIHLFVAPEDQELYKNLRALPVSARRDLLEFGQEGELPYIVTEKLPETGPAREWFRAKAPKTATQSADAVRLAGVWKTGTPIPDALKVKAPSPITEAPKPELPPLPQYADATRVIRLSDLPPAPAPEAAAEDEFERLFGAAKPAAAQPEPPPAAPPSPEPGEFTRMFQAVKPAEPPPPPAPPQPDLTRAFQTAKQAIPVAPPPPEPPADDRTRMFQTAVTAEMAVPKPTPAPEPGEFTRMFQASKQAAPPEPAKQEPGEFTRMFQSSPQPQSRPQEPAPKQEPSEFTRFFESPLQPKPLGQQPQGITPPLTPPAPPQNRAGEFTQMFGNPKAPPAPPPPPLGSAGSATGAFATPQMRPIQPLKPSGPSDFTQMMSAGSAATPTLGQRPPSAMSSAPPPRQETKKSNLPLFIAFGAAFLALILVFVMLALRK